MSDNARMPRSTVVLVLLLASPAHTCDDNSFALFGCEAAKGRKLIVACSERPRFYIHDLQDLVPCDPETPVGTACVK